MTMERVKECVTDAVKRELGYPEMKPEQLEVAVTFIEGRDVFAVLPIGYIHTSTHIPPTFMEELHGDGLLMRSNSQDRTLDEDPAHHMNRCSPGLGTTPVPTGTGSPHHSTPSTHSTPSCVLYIGVHRCKLTNSLMYTPETSSYNRYTAHGRRIKLRLYIQTHTQLHLTNLHAWRMLSSGVYSPPHIQLLRANHLYA